MFGWPYFIVGQWDQVEGKKSQSDSINCYEESRKPVNLGSFLIWQTNASTIWAWNVKINIAAQWTCSSTAEE